MCLRKRYRKKRHRKKRHCKKRHPKKRHRKKRHPYLKIVKYAIVSKKKHQERHDKKNCLIDMEYIYNKFTNRNQIKLQR